MAKSFFQYKLDLKFNGAVNMPIYQSELQKNSQSFKDNFEHLQTLTNELKAHLERASKGGGEESIKRHHSRGKMTASE